jgi:hypothetical protein
MTSDLTTEASLRPDRWGRILFSLPDNLLGNSGFQKELATAPTVGNWNVATSKNGAEARVVDTQAFTGSRSLLLEQKTPLVWTNDKDLWKDCGNVVVGQRLAVAGGQAYDLRFAYRSEGLEMKPRGEPSAHCIIEITWLSPQGRRVGGCRTFQINNSHNTWQVVFPRQTVHRAHNRPGQPFMAPEGATAAEIRIFLVNRTETNVKVWIDQVEFAPARK